MSSALLLQKRKEDASPAGQGVRIAAIESKIERISLSVAGGAVQPPTSRPFEFEVDMSESGWTEDSLCVSYSFTFGREASGHRCSVSGKAKVRFSRFNPGTDFQTLGSDITNEIAIEIFRKSYDTVYLLHSTLGVEAPSPWITQQVSLSSRDKA